MKRLWMAILLLLAIPLAVGACAGASPLESKSAPEVVATRVVERPAEAPMPAQAPVVAGMPAQEGAGAPQLTPGAVGPNVDVRKIIYQGQMFLIVEDTEQAAQEIQAMAESAGGYVARMNGYRQGDDRLIYDITIRVPADKFENARIALRKLAVRVERESISTEDVTDQYYDIEARLKTLKETEAELTELLRETRERGGDVDEIMKIYDRLTRIRSDIESLQGQLNRLDKLVAFSTLDIHLEPHILAEPIKPQNEWSFAEIVHSSVNTLVNILAGLAALAIRFVIIVLPTFLLLLLPVLLVLWAISLWQKRRKRRESP